MTLYIARTHPDYRKTAGVHRRASRWDLIRDRLRAAVVPEFLERR